MATGAMPEARPDDEIDGRDRRPPSVARSCCRGQEAPLAQIALRRRRETEVHHADLGLDGFDIDDWSSGYVQRDLEQMQMAWRAKQPTGTADLPLAVKALVPARRLAWLLGRLAIDGHEPADVF